MEGVGAGVELNLKPPALVVGVALDAEGPGAGAAPNWNPPVLVVVLVVDCVGTAANLKPPVVVLELATDDAGAPNMNPVDDVAPPVEVVAPAAPPKEVPFLLIGSGLFVVVSFLLLLLSPPSFASQAMHVSLSLGLDTPQLWHLIIVSGLFKCAYPEKRLPHPSDETSVALLTEHFLSLFNFTSNIMFWHADSSLLFLYPQLGHFHLPKLTRFVSCSLYSSSS